MFFFNSWTKTIVFSQFFFETRQPRLPTSFQLNRYLHIFAVYKGLYYPAILELRWTYQDFTASREPGRLKKPFTKNKKNTKTSSWHLKLGGETSNICLFSPLLGEDSQFDYMIFFKWWKFRSQQKKQSNRKISANPRIRRKSWSVIRRSITVIMWFQIQDRLQDHMGQKCLDWWKQLMLVVFFWDETFVVKRGMTSRLLSYRWMGSNS